MTDEERDEEQVLCVFVDGLWHAVDAPKTGAGHLYQVCSLESVPSNAAFKWGVPDCDACLNISKAGLWEWFIR